jgi:hypothetical protein
VLAKVVERGDDVGERVVDLVRDARGHHADRGAAIGLHELRLDRLHLGHVEERTDELHRSALAVHLAEAAQAVRRDPADAAVWPHRPVLLLVAPVAAGVDPAAGADADQLAVVRVDEREERLEVRDQRRADPEDLAAARGPFHRPVRRGVEGPDPGGVERQREPLLALAQRLLGPAPLGGVADDADQDALAVELGRLRADLDRDHGPVPAAVLGVEAHRARHGRREVRARTGPGARGAQVVHREPAHLFPRPAVGDGRGGVGLQDPAVMGADEEDDVARVLGEEVVASNRALLAAERPAEREVEPGGGDEDEDDPVRRRPPGHALDVRRRRREERVGEADPGDREQRVERGDPEGDARASPRAACWRSAAVVPSGRAEPHRPLRH